MALYQLRSLILRQIVTQARKTMNETTITSHKSTVQIGDSAEQLALKFLQSQNLQLIERNFRCKHGEIDLIMLDKSSLVFVEVRYRKHLQFGDGAESVDYRKQQKILKTVEFFLQRYVKYNQYPCRLDVVSIGPGDNDINWIPNAFES